MEIRASIYPTRRTGAPLMYNHGCDLATPKVLLDHADYRQMLKQAADICQSCSIWV